MSKKRRVPRHIISSRTGETFCGSWGEMLDSDHLDDVCKKCYRGNWYVQDLFPHITGRPYRNSW